MRNLAVLVLFYYVFFSILHFIVWSLHNIDEKLHNNNLLLHNGMQEGVTINHKKMHSNASKCCNDSGLLHNGNEELHNSQ